MRPEWVRVRAAGDPRPRVGWIRNQDTCSTSSPSCRSSSPRPAGLQTVYWDGVDDQGRLFGGTLQLDVPPKGSVRGVLPATSRSLTHNLLPPNSANRLDLVFVGDGYTSAQLGTYAARRQHRRLVLRPRACTARTSPTS